MPTALDTIVADLSGCDRQERIDLLLDFAKSSASLARSVGRPQGRFPSCRGMPVSGLPVRRVRWRPSRSATPMPRSRPPRSEGSSPCFSRDLNGATVEEVLQVPGDLVERCGLAEILGMLRVRGLTGVLRRLKAEVTRAAIDQARSTADIRPQRRFRMSDACSFSRRRLRVRGGPVC